MPRSTGRCAALLSVAVALSSLAACDFAGGDSDESSSPAPASTRVLTAADLSPLEPSGGVREENKIPDGSPFWSCGGIEFRPLLDEGLEATGRYFVNGVDNWSVYSLLLTTRDLSADEALAAMERAHADCAAEGQDMPELELGAGRWGYRSEHRGTTDAVRGYAVVGEHELAQVSIFGLHDQEPPEELERLLDKAAERAGGE